MSTLRAGAFLGLLLTIVAGGHARAADPPEAHGPVPSARQLA